MRQPKHISTQIGRDAEWALRVDLAAAFRLAVYFNWHEAVGNHFSVAVSSDGRQFLMNPRWRHFARITASDLQLFDSDDAEAWLTARQAELDAQRANSLRRGGQRLWADAARKYLMECKTRNIRTLDLISFHVQLLLPYIGALPLRDVCNDSLEQFKLERQEDGRKNSTINRSLEVVRSTLIRAARVWREDGEPWLTVPPLIEMLASRGRRG